MPHITLFGPYNTDDGHQAEATVRKVGRHFDLVPFRLDGFGHFGRNVVYIDVVPSQSLCELRRTLSRRLRPISYNHPPYDSNKCYDFHVTITHDGISDESRDIYDYCERAMHRTPKGMRLG